MAPAVGTFNMLLLLLLLMMMMMMMMIYENYIY
jgi:hypothetical protein